MLYESLESRLLRKCIKTDGCWEWIAGKNIWGYGMMCYQYKQTTAQRWAYVAWRGPIPDGMHVCHSCDNPGCINPDHLWLGTHKENMIDCNRKGRRNRAPNTMWVNLKRDQTTGRFLANSQ